MIASSVEDRLAIRELCEAIGDAIMRSDAEAWGNAWAPEGVWVPAPGVEIRGREAIVEKWKAAISALDFCGFFAAPGPMRVDGDAATGSLYRAEFLYLKNGSRRNIIGRYDDEYVRISGRWYLSRRAALLLQDEIIPA